MGALGLHEKAFVFGGWHSWGSLLVDDCLGLVLDDFDLKKRDSIRYKFKLYFNLPERIHFLKNFFAGQFLIA